MKETICTIAGVVGSFIAGLFGGWDASMVTLLLFMGVDALTGIMTAYAGRSSKSQSGKLSSKSCWRGLRLPAAGSGGGTPGYYPGHIVHSGCGVHRVYRQRADLYHGKRRAARRTAAGYFDKGNRTIAD